MKKPKDFIYKIHGDVMASVSVFMSQIGFRLFHINVGRAWTGNDIVKMKDGSILIRDPRPFKTGVQKGYVDLTGWRSTLITQEMVGNTIAVFSAFEAKTKNDKLKKEQAEFLKQVKDAGGIIGVLRCEEDCSKHK